MNNVPQITVSTNELADIFSVSERQIQRLVQAGVLDTLNSGNTPHKFDLATATQQYINFLQSQISVGNWAPYSRIIGNVR